MNFIENESAQKLRGGYYTPLDLATFIARWVKEINPKRVLEPSCGDGVFFEALAKAKGFKGASVLGFELEEEESAKAQLRARESGLAATTVHNADFLQWALDQFIVGDKFDAVVGNPHSFDTNICLNHFRQGQSRYSSNSTFPSPSTLMPGFLSS